MKKFTQWGYDDKGSQINNYRYGFYDAVKLIAIVGTILYFIWR